MSVALSLSVRVHICEPCSRERGEPVSQLVKMMPQAGVLNGQLVTMDEWWCCPGCFRAYFPAKKNRSTRGNSKANAAT